MLETLLLMIFDPLSPDCGLDWKLPSWSFAPDAHALRLFCDRLFRTLIVCFRHFLLFWLYLGWRVMLVAPIKFVLIYHKLSLIWRNFMGPRVKTRI